MLGAAWLLIKITSYAAQSSKEEAWRVRLLCRVLRAPVRLSRFRYSNGVKPATSINGGGSSVPIARAAHLFLSLQARHSLAIASL